MLSELRHDGGTGVSVDWLKNFYFGVSLFLFKNTQNEPL